MAMFFASCAATAGHAAEPAASIPFPAGRRVFSGRFALTTAAAATTPSARRAFRRIASADDSEEGPQARPSLAEAALCDGDRAPDDSAARAVVRRVEGDALLHAVPGHD